MNDLDANNDGEVDFTEFIILMGALTVACNDFFLDSKPEDKGKDGAGKKDWNCAREAGVKTGGGGRQQRKGEGEGGGKACKTDGFFFHFLSYAISKYYKPIWEEMSGAQFMGFTEHEEFSGSAVFPHANVIHTTTNPDQVPLSAARDLMYT